MLGQDKVWKGHRLTAIAEETSSLAVEAQEYFTLELMLLIIDPEMLSFMQAHDARACGPPGQ
jgi:hypothetical protein